MANAADMEQFVSYLGRLVITSRVTLSISTNENKAVISADFQELQLHEKPVSLGHILLSKREPVVWYMIRVFFQQNSSENSGVQCEQTYVATDTAIFDKEEITLLASLDFNIHLAGIGSELRRNVDDEHGFMREDDSYKCWRDNSILNSAL